MCLAARGQKKFSSNGFCYVGEEKLPHALPASGGRQGTAPPQVARLQRRIFRRWLTEGGRGFYNGGNKGEQKESGAKKPEQTGHEPCGCSSDQLREKLPSTGEIQSVADAMRQLGDSSRLRIFWVLCHCEECVMGLSALVEMSSPAVSHHLRLLKSAGLIVSRRQGKEMYYRAADTEAAQVLHHTIEQLAALSCPGEEEEA